MRLVTKNIIRKIFQDIATAFYQINSFGYGPADEFVQKTMDENDQELEGTIIYPRLYVTPEPSTITGKRINRNYTIVVADLVRKGRENMTEAESDTEQILTDVIAQIQDQSYGFLLDTSSISIVPFTGRFVDEVTGHYAEVSLYTGFEFDRCQIPSEFISISNPYIPLDEEGTNERDPLSWHKTGNTLTTSSTLGSNNDQDWRIIHNNVTIGTVQATGLTINGAIDYTTGAIQSLNGLTAKSQVFAVGSSGTDLNIVSSGSTHTISIPDAGVGITGGLVNNDAQTIAGVKTFSSAPIISGFTPGSVIFMGPNSEFAQHNAKFFYNDLIERLHIGGNNPQSTLHITDNIGAANGGIRFENAIPASPGIGQVWRLAFSGNNANLVLQPLTVDAVFNMRDLAGNNRFLLRTAGNIDFNISSVQTFNISGGATILTGPLNGSILIARTSTNQEVVHVRQAGGARQIGFHGVTPVSRAVVPTGSSTDAVITALQNLGLISQS